MDRWLHGMKVLSDAYKTDIPLEVDQATKQQLDAGGIGYANVGVLVRHVALLKAL
jgi:hypothetical protein